MSSIKYRHLSRSSSHRQALLRNLVTSLIEHETISTTYAKAKEAQRMAEKLITLGKRNTSSSRIQAQQIFYEPEKHLPKLFGPLRERYASRPGGYTRVLRQENREKDQSATAILCLVDGPKDIRWHMTARTLVHERTNDAPMREMTLMNVRKVTRFREDGLEQLEEEVRKLERGETPKGSSSSHSGTKKFGVAEEAEEEEWEDVDDEVISHKEARRQRLARERETNDQEVEALKTEVAEAGDRDDRKTRRLKWKLKEIERRREELLKEEFPVSLGRSIRIGGSRKRRRLAARQSRITNITVEV